MSYPMKRNQKYTYAEYLTWSDDERWELIDGIPYNMTPAPSRSHQEVLNAINYAFYHFLKDKPCAVYIAPFNVRLGEYESEDACENVVQPDIAIICDQNKLDEKGCKGAPDLIVEVLSPSTAKMDLVYKLNLYEKYKVREYWIVDPHNQYVSIYTLDEQGNYGKPEANTREEGANVGIFELAVDLKEIFSERA